MRLRKWFRNTLLSISTLIIMFFGSCVDFDLTLLNVFILFGLLEILAGCIYLLMMYDNVLD